MDDETGLVRVTKLDAACRQLRAGIRLLCNDGDPIVAHTLIGAASRIVSDLVSKSHPGESWDWAACEANKISRREYFRIRGRVQNFLKHADTDNDPQAELSYSIDDTDGLTFLTAMNLKVMGTKLPEAEVFELWYLACRGELNPQEDAPYAIARQAIGDLRQLSRHQKLEVAQRLLDEHSRAPASFTL